MTRPERLSAQDSTYLYVESGHAPMHVGILAIVDRLAATPEEIEEYAGARLGQIPRLRKRVVHVPGELARPVLAEDPAFDVAQHVHVVKNPVAYDRQRAMAFVAELMSRPMPRDRPLWGAWLFDLEEQQTGAILLVHHCLSDGVAGLGLMAHLLSLSPDEEATDVPAEPAPTAEPLPAHVGLLAGALGDAARDGTREALAVASTLLRAARPSAINRMLRETRPDDLLGVAGGLLRGVTRARGTSSLRAPVTGQRRFLTTSVSLDDIKRIKRHHDCTVNDVVLACVTGGLRRLLEVRGDPLEDHTVTASVPVNLRRPEDGDDTRLNAVSNIVIALPVDREGPGDRLDVIAGRMTELKGSSQASHMQQLMHLADLAPGAFLRAVSRTVGANPPADVLVTNLAGPPMPVYLMGSQVREIMPLAPILGTTALSVAVMSYTGEMHFCIATDPSVIGEVDVFVEGVGAEVGFLLEELP
jgi:diacylglycerol O-acyltransferase